MVIGVRSSLTDPGPDFTVADAILRLLVVHPTKLNARGGKPFFLGNAPWKDIAIDGAGAHAGPKSVMLQYLVPRVLEAHPARRKVDYVQ